MKKSHLILSLLVIASFLSAQTGRELPFQKWALTPPMGWNSWDCYGPSVNEAQVKANTDYMAANLKQYGWEYIVVDIRWYVDNQYGGGYNAFNQSTFIYDAYGRMMPSTKRFPSAANGAGFKPLADYIHSKGLKFGIHIMRGIPVVAVNNKLPILGSSKTAADIYSTSGQCVWLQDNYTILNVDGAQQYYNSIFDLYASWGLDFVKVDDLSRPYAQDEIEMIRKAIDRTGRKIVLSMSPGETPVEKFEHAQTHANMWRTVDDFWDNWSQLSYSFGILERWAPHIKQGAWPDADMLPLGRIEIYNDGGAGRQTKFSKNEQLCMMTLWSIFKSPLIFGGNMPDNDEYTNSLITNKEVLDMHRNSVNNKQWFRKNGQVAWTADDPKTGDKFVALFNNGDDGFIDPSCISYRSGNITRLTNNYGVSVNMPLNPADKELYLIVNDGGDGNGNDQADWINPTLYKTNGDSIKLTHLDWEYATSGWNQAAKGKSVSGGTLNVKGKTFADGIGTHSRSIILFHIPEGCIRFKTFAGLDKAGTDQTGGASVEFMVATKDPKVKNVDLSRAIANSGRISRTMQREGVQLAADITGAQKLYLVVSDAGDNTWYDHADWVNPVIYNAEGESVLLTLLKWKNAVSGWEQVKINKSVAGNDLKINNKTYNNGFGTHANSIIEFELPAGYTKFKSFCGFDDEVLTSNVGVTVNFAVFTQDPLNNSIAPVVVDLNELGFKGKCRVRDMWEKKDVGVYSGAQFAPSVENHGAKLYRISRLKKK